MRTLSHSCPLERGRKIAALGTHAVALSDEDKKNACQWDAFLPSVLRQLTVLCLPLVRQKHNTSRGPGHPLQLSLCFY